jgi:hypothetical protein
MRNFWVAIIGVILFAGTSFATAPVVQDIPDVKLLTGSGQVDDFDLSDYVTDFDDDVSTLTYSIESQVGFAVDPASIAGSLVDIAGSSSADEGTITYRAVDAQGYNSSDQEDTQVVKYSSLLLVGPSLTEDRNLDPDNDVLPRTVVIVADGVETTTGIKALATGATPDSMSVCIADLDGNNLTAAGATAASGDLEAAIDANGVLTLQAPAGSYPITDGLPLSGAYRVGVIAGLGSDWDGLELLVSTARFPVGISESDLTAGMYSQFCDFEGNILGALPIGQSVMRGLADDVNPRWYQSASGLASVVDTGVPTSTWATSGQALKVSLASAASSVFIQSEMFTDIEAGETVTVAANMYTTCADDGNALADAVPTVTFFMGSFHSPSNYEGVVLQQGGGTTNSTEQLPLQEWRTVKASFTADTVGATLLGDTFDIYQKGYQVGLAVKAPAANGSFPLDVYIDNVRVYRDKSDFDKALAATEIIVAEKDTTSEAFDGTFESATAIADLGFTGSGTASIDDGSNNAPNIDGTKALKIDAGLVRAEVRLDASTCGGVDNRGDGIYGATLWFKTDAQAAKNVPGIMFFFGDALFKNVPFADVGYAGAPLAGGGWKKVTLSSLRFGGGVVQIAAALRTGAVPDRPYFPTELTGTDAYGALADASVYVDDIQFHMVQDDSMYFDRSVFP